MPLRPLFQMNGTAPAALPGRTLSCVSCGLAKGVPAEDHEVITKRMSPWGENRLGLMIIGEAPGREEDHRGMPWQGRAGRVLASALREHDIDLARDCVSLNAVNCRPVENRTPLPFEVACCREVKVLPAIRQYRPKLILLMGGSAVSSVIGSVLAEAQNAAIGRWRGNHIPLPSLGAWLAPTFHPSYIMREEKRPEVETVWRKDIAAALPLLDEPVPDPGALRDKVILLHDERSILRALERVKVKKGYLSFDYETTGLRAALHDLVSISFAQSSDWAFSFMYPRGGPVHDAWRDILMDPAIAKISHNLSFEYEWSRFHFGVDRIVWAWDSMLAAHVVDNRPGICGLKHQAFVNFGVPSYDTNIEPYLKSRDPRNPAALNRIAEFIEKYGEDELLIYNGIDALVAYRLAQKQMEQLGATPPSKVNGRTPPPPPGDREGATYDHDRDYVRLNKQAFDVWRVMSDGRWHTIPEIGKVTGHTDRGISARIRDFRKEKYGSHTVHGENISGGLWRYRLVPNPDVKVRRDDITTRSLPAASGRG